MQQRRDIQKNKNVKLINLNQYSSSPGYTESYSLRFSKDGRFLFSVDPRRTVLLGPQAMLPPHDRSMCSESFD